MVFGWCFVQWLRWVGFLRIVISGLWVMIGGFVDCL